MIFIFATELEAQCFRELAPRATVEICGVGAAQCAAAVARIICAMNSRGESQKLILAGIAGAYPASAVAVGEVVEVVSEQIASLPERFGQEYSSPRQTELRAVRSNSVNCSGESLRTSGAEIENMEGAAFEALCNEFGVDHLHIRAISNSVGEPFEKWRVAQACQALAAELSKIYLKIRK